MKTTQTTVLFKDLSDESLVREYIGYKELCYNGAAMKSPRLGRNLRSLDIIIAVARKRGLRLPV